MVFLIYIFSHFTPLHIACYKKNAEIVELLLNFPGIDINIVDKKGILIEYNY